MKLIRIIIICFLVVVASGMARVSAFQDKENVWQAVVKVDSTAMYSGPSASSHEMTHLKRGDVVTIGLEITKEDGKWYSVTLPSQPTGVGYMNGKDLDVG